MAKWDHADLISLPMRARIYPQYCTRDQIRQAVASLRSSKSAEDRKEAQELENNWLGGRTMNQTTPEKKTEKKEVPKVQKIEDFSDFGFTTMDSEQFRQSLPKAEAYNTPGRVEKKVRDIMDMIIPFLNNLMRDPEKDILKWPDRAKKVQELKEKIVKRSTEE